MGLSSMLSSSSYDSGHYKTDCPHCSEVKEVVTTVRVLRPGNPDPNKYKVIKDAEYRGWYLVEIKYDGVTNYEGRKILLYRGIGKKDLDAQISIDPHFSDNKNYHSPFARFEPTDQGWSAAIFLIKTMSH